MFHVIQLFVFIFGRIVETTIAVHPYLRCFDSGSKMSHAWLLGPNVFGPNYPVW